MSGRATSAALVLAMACTSSILASADPRAQPPTQSRSVMVTGCVQAADLATVTPPTSDERGRTPSAETPTKAYVLANARPAISDTAVGTSGRSGASAEPELPSGRIVLEGRDMEPHVGQQVKISGTLVSPAGAGKRSDEHRLRIGSLETLSTSCSRAR